MAKPDYLLFRYKGLRENIKRTRDFWSQICGTLAFTLVVTAIVAAGIWGANKGGPLIMVGAVIVSFITITAIAVGAAEAFIFYMLKRKFAELRAFRDYKTFAHCMEISAPMEEAQVILYLSKVQELGLHDDSRYKKAEEMRQILGYWPMALGEMGAILNEHEQIAVREKIKQLEAAIPHQKPLHHDHERP